MPTGIYDRTKSKPRSPQSEETKHKISIANTGKKRTPQQIQNIKNSLPKNRKHSIETKEKISKNNIGKRHNWKGGKTIFNKYKFVFSPNHPCGIHNGYVAEHRLIIEKQLGRFLKPTEVIHHVDGNKLNNKINNLLAFKNAGFHRHFHNGKENKLGIIFDGRNFPIQPIKITGKNSS